jgi:uncharacterized protein (TIGR02444 family)
MTGTDTQSATPSAQGSPFWRFSLRLYRAPGVGDACIALQEESGVDVNLLLFLLWQATERRALTAADVKALDQTVGGWRDTAVIPLRNLRRALKSSPGLVASNAAEAFRTRIKAVELEAERLQQQTMYALSDTIRFETTDSPLAAARANVDAYQAVHAKTFPPLAIDTILGVFATMFGATASADAADRRG